MHRLVSAGLLGAVALVFAAPLAAAPGDVDATFGVGGVVRIDIGYFDSATDLAVQPDRKIVVTGTVSHEGGGRNVVLARLRGDGSLDPGFGTGGVVVPDRYHQVAPRLALQPDGKIVLATRGETDGGSTFVYRFAADGTPDAAFGTAGTAVVETPAGLSNNGVAGVGIVADGRIVVIVRVDTGSGEANTAFARFDADGTPDVSFGTGGFVLVPGFRLPLAFALQPDGRMLVAGFAVLPGRFFGDACVARFNADGTLDASFGAAGVALAPRPMNGTDFQSVALAADGSVFAGGRTYGDNPYISQWFLAKFTGGGGLDPAFGSAGRVIHDPGPEDNAIGDLLVDAAGIYAATSIRSSARGLPVALFGANGGLNLSYGIGGVAGVPDPTAFGAASSIAMHGGGRVLAFGAIQTFHPTFNQDLYLARYEGFGCPLTSVDLDLAPRTLNRHSSGRWITGLLEPEPPASPADIDVGSIRLAGAVPVDPSAPAVLGDADDDGRPDLSVKFGRIAVERVLGPGESVLVTVEGDLAGGCFEATDWIRVFGEPTMKLTAESFELGLQASVPNPATHLSPAIELPDAGPATLAAYDVSGRVVKLRKVGRLGPGRHVVTLAAPGELSPGIYLVELIQGQRRLVARAAIVR